MSTRGAWGYFDGTNHKVTYNHSDSYPEWLGTNICKFIRNVTPAELKFFAQDILMVDQSEVLVKDNPAYLRFIERADGENKSKLFEPVPKNFGSSKKDWYYMLRNYQGDIEAISKLGIMHDDFEFLKDSLFCEWAYIINVKRNVLEIYKGFQEKRGRGRYQKLWPDKPEPSYAGGPIYYPVSLIKTIPFKDVPAEMSPETIPELFDKEEETA